MSRRARPVPTPPLLAVVLTALLAAGCDRPAPSREPPRVDGAAQIAAERAAEAQQLDAATLARLTREVEALHTEIDQMKASRQALDQAVLEGRLQALESRATAADSAVTPAPTAAPTPTSPTKTAPAKHHAALTVKAPAMDRTPAPPVKKALSDKPADTR